MRPTKYNKRITVQRREKDDNEIGGWSNEWSDWYESWASVKPLRGSKRMEYGQIGSTNIYEVEMRERVNNVDNECRIVYNGNNYQILFEPQIDDNRVYFEMAKK